MFPAHNPAHQVFNWHCENSISHTDQSLAAIAMREPVFRIRKLYNQPIGRNLPYDDSEFRASYLLAYFPYYIEPICHVLEKANMPDTYFTKRTLNVGFFGGGPCPEVLGLAAYLRKKAPGITNVEATVFDRQPGWSRIQQELVPSMLPTYKSMSTTFTIKSKTCDVVECLARDCNCGIANKDIIIAQNFMTEVYTAKRQAIETFERLINRSQCRYIVFVDNLYDKVREMMNELSIHLYNQGLIKQLARTESTTIRPNFRLPQEMQQHIFTGEDGLIPRYNVKYHHMVLEIER